MAISRANFIGCNAIVVSEFNLGLVGVAGVADEGEVVLLLGALGGTQQLHTHSVGIEIDRTLKVADAQHSV